VETEVNSSVVIRRFVKEWLEYPSVKAVQRSVAGKRRMMNGRYYCTFITPEAKETLLSYLNKGYKLVARANTS